MNKKIILIGVTVLAVAGVAWAGRAIYRAKQNIVTIDVYNAPLADVIKQLERQTRETILARGDLQTKVTLNVNNVPLDQALDQLGRQAGVNWSKWHAVHDSAGALTKLESALRQRAKIEDAGWTNLAPANFPGEPSWQAGGPNAGGGGEIVIKERKPVMIKIDSGDVKDGNVDAAVQEKLKAAGIDPASLAQASGAQPQTLDVDVDVQAPPGAGGAGGEVMLKAGGPQPRIRMVTRTRDGSGKMVEEVWSPEYLVMEQRLRGKLGEPFDADPTEAAARELAKKVKADLTTLYVLSSAPGGFPFAGKMMRQVHSDSGGTTNGTPGQPPPMPDIEGVVRRAEAENYTRLTPEQRVQRLREKQAAKTNQ